MDGKKTNLTDPMTFVGMNDISNVDFRLNKKGFKLGDFDCEADLDCQRMGSGNGANRLIMSTKIDQIGWVNLKLANKGYIDRSNEDEVAANDEAKLVFDLGKFSKEVHTDLSASLEYDLCAKAAALNVGFLNDVGLAEKNPEDDGKAPPAGVRAQLKTSIPVGDSLGLDDFANAEHKLKLYYLHESVGDIGVEFHPGKALDGKVEVSRDAYKLSVPFSKDGVDKDKITFEKSWMMDFA